MFLFKNVLNARTHTQDEKERTRRRQRPSMRVVVSFYPKGATLGFFFVGDFQFHQMNKRSGKEIKQKPEPKKKKEENDNNNNKTGRKQNKGATTNVGQENNRA